MASVATIEFVETRASDAPPFSLIEQKGLVARLVKELTRAGGELVDDPRGFLSDLFSADTRDAKRRQRIYIGLACAVLAHVVLLVLIASLGWQRMFVKPAAGHPKEDVTWVPRTSFTPDKAGESPAGGNNGSAGGGGDRNPLPGTRGPLPQTSRDHQIVKPNTPSLAIPAIQVPPRIAGPDGVPPPPGIALGVPTGVIAAAPSPGTGEGGGLGGSRGSGAGAGDGPSAGLGARRGKGGGTAGNPDGAGSKITEVDFSQLPSQPSYTPFRWIHRPTPVVTAEAQDNKASGVVLLRATFHADGTISDIEVVMPVDFMTESAIDALVRSRFRPATVNGKPITVRKVPVKVSVHY